MGVSWQPRKRTVCCLWSVRLTETTPSAQPQLLLTIRAQELKKEQLVESRTTLSHCQSNITAYSYNKTFFKTRSLRTRLRRRTRGVKLEEDLSPALEALALVTGWISQDLVCQLEIFSAT